MSAHTCTVPVRVELRGAPNAANLSQMSDAIAGAVAGRLVEAAKAITARTGWDAYGRTSVPLALRFSGLQLDADLQSRITVAIEVGVARAISSVPAPASVTPPRTPPAPLFPPPPPRVPLAAEMTRKSWRLNGVLMFEIKTRDPEARIDIQPAFATLDDGRSRLQITVFRDSDLTVGLLPGALPALAHLASEIAIQEVILDPEPTRGRQGVASAHGAGAHEPAQPSQRRDDASGATSVRAPRDATAPAAPGYAPASSSQLSHGPDFRLVEDSPSDADRADASGASDGPETELASRDADHQALRWPSAEAPGPLPIPPIVTAPGIGSWQAAGPPESPAPAGGAQASGPETEIVQVELFEARTLLTEEEHAQRLQKLLNGDGIILPFRRRPGDGAAPSPIYATRLPGGRLRVRLRPGILVSPDADDPDLSLPPSIEDGVVVSETELVGVKFFDEGAIVTFFPALLLTRLDDDDTRLQLVLMGHVERVRATARLSRIRLQEYRGQAVDLRSERAPPLVETVEQLDALAQARMTPSLQADLAGFEKRLLPSYEAWRAAADPETTLAEARRFHGSIARQLEAVLKTIAALRAALATMNWRA